MSRVRITGSRPAGSIDLTGQRFGRLTVMHRIGTRHGQALWRCLCDCEGARDVVSWNLRQGLTRSCGCIRREISQETIKRTRPAEPPDPLENFMAKINLGGGADYCWIWEAAKVRGYGAIRVKGRTTYAHRFAYEQLVGPIPDGLELDHLCRIPACCNPAHLEPVTHAENVRRGITSRRDSKIRKETT